VGDAGTILILPHNDPDPDAIASAVTLRHLLMEALTVESTIAYQGIAGRAENRALLRYLGQPLRPLTDTDLAGEVPIALVDTQPGAGNNALPAGSGAAFVIDHHTWREPTATAAYVDVRPEAGATSTILTEYLQEAGLEPEPPLATALFYGIKSDTRGLSCGAGPADLAAYLYLQPRVDTRALAEIEYAQVPASYFKSFDATLQAARVFDGVVVAYVGLMAYPDLAAEMARLLLRLEKSRRVVCMGVHRDVLILSVRTQSPTGGAE
jgi:nanoRNase/pAp phosphatase (c-di-AMP/oligoRNAs hydrolase)